MQIIKWDKTSLKKIRSFQTSSEKDLSRKVQKILLEVRLKGDSALQRFTREFDGIDLPTKRFRVSEGDINQAYEKIKSDFISSLKYINENITRYYKKDLPRSYRVNLKDGSFLAKQYRPIERVGIYIPAGTAPLVSTVYMTVIPAKIAGVKEIVITTPPSRETAEIDPNILAVANLLGVKEIYRVGGAQAIAGLAFGTRSIHKVDKIVGPGNAYVTEAKRQVFGHVDIDMVAGPSEICIIADSTADINFVTCDLLAQTEHFCGIGILITNSKKIVDQMKKRIETGYIVSVANLEEACDVSNQIAPEHLEIMTKTPNRLLKRITHAGSVFLGSYSPAVVGDYFAGPSHVLPTGGSARVFSPLGISDFMKASQIIGYTKESLLKAREHVRKFTEMEGMILHRISLESRFVNEKHDLTGKTYDGKTSEEIK